MTEAEVEKTQNGGVPVESKTSSPDVEMEDAQDVITGEADQEKAGKVEDADEQEQDEEEDEEEEESLTLPLSKIKKIFKMDPDYIAATQGAVFATGLATELFIQYLVEQASSLAKRSKRKKILYSDFSDAVKGHDSLIFLKGTVPEKQKLEDLLAKNVIDSTGRPTELNPATAHADIIDKNETEPAKEATGKTKKGKSAKPLTKGQQTLDFSAEKIEKPIKKAVIHDLIANEDDTPASEDVVMIDQ